MSAEALGSDQCFSHWALKIQSPTCCAFINLNLVTRDCGETYRLLTAMTTWPLHPILYLYVLFVALSRMPGIQTFHGHELPPIVVIVAIMNTLTVNIVHTQTFINVLFKSIHPKTDRNNCSYLPAWTKVKITLMSQSNSADNFFFF